MVPGGQRGHFVAGFTTILDDYLSLFTDQIDIDEKYTCDFRFKHGNIS
jgi:hypothetical protein